MRRLIRASARLVVVVLGWHARARERAYAPGGLGESHTESHTPHVYRHLLSPVFYIHFYIQFVTPIFDANFDNF